MIPRHKGVVKSLIYIADNLNRPIWIKDLVSASTLSRRGLFKAFKKHTGRTPGEELEIARIEQSKAILAEGTHEMKDLAKICGYRSVNTFYVAFKRVVGTSPRKFQQQYSR
jgi:AraC-like DNA-binding protein